MSLWDPTCSKLFNLAQVVQLGFNSSSGIFVHRKCFWWSHLHNLSYVTFTSLGVGILSSHAVTFMFIWPFLAPWTYLSKIAIPWLNFVCRQWQIVLSLVWSVIYCSYLPGYRVLGYLVSMLHDLRMAYLFKEVNPESVTNTVQFTLALENNHFWGSLENLHVKVKSFSAGPAFFEQTILLVHRTDKYNFPVFYIELIGEEQTLSDKFCDLWIN